MTAKFGVIYEKITGNDPYNVPMEISTTMDTSLQNSINEVKQNEVLVDSKKDKSFGVLNIKNNKYTM